MRLEKKFFDSFFYSFLICIFLSSMVVILILIIFTNNYFDKITSQLIINLGKKFSKIDLNQVNILLTTSLIKIQSSLNEQILLYQKKAEESLQSEELIELNDTSLKCALDIDEEYCENYPEEAEISGVWLLDNETRDEDLDETKIEVKQQLISFNNILQNLDATLEATKPYALSYYFYFIKTDLYVSYPIIADCESEFVSEMTDYEYDTSTCVNDEGQLYNIYKLNCEPFFINMLKSKTDIFDNNYLSNKNKTIFITNFYNIVDDNSSWEYSMCIEFDDPISNDKGYSCVDVENLDMVLTLEKLNTNLLGYYFISNVGFNHVFYFPHGTISPRTSTENIYKWNSKYSLKEKEYFFKEVKKKLTSNYIDNIKGIFDEIIVNGSNSSSQYFFINGNKYKYSIYPIILKNLKGQNEHIFSIIYIYNEELYFEKFKNYISSVIIRIIIELILFFIFGSAILYIIYLTFNSLSKNVVIPIKNVNYMLKGINIGGDKRLEYLNFLKKRQDENFEKLEKIYLYENENNNNKEKELIKESETNSISSYENELMNKNNLMNKKNNDDLTNKKLNTYSNLDQKFDEDNNYIEKELCFYDFDEQLLQYRAKEVDHLVKILMNLKGALNLTSSDREVTQIIDFSFSESIFKDLDNNEGAIICQSNIGNLQSQLLEFDKAIYHLALSLQDNKLKKFLNRNLSDEFDESDWLLNKISHFFNNKKNNESNNILAEKQKNNAKDNFSKKIIGILINTRYCRLIHAYYMFFKNISKLKKANDNNINGQFMNTLYHTINYYHKVLIQFIFLSFSKNDLVKIGESILDYIEFMIKFKLKSSSSDKYFLKIKNKNNPEFRTKQEFKKKMFNKIIKWYYILDHYILYIKDNSSFNDIKNVVDDYKYNLNVENSEFKWEDQSALIFKTNIQKADFLKAKLCLCCKHYNDALFYFIRAAKKKSIVIDGLIKKKSLKHIYKLLIKIKKKYEFFGIKNLNMNKQLKEYKKDINMNINKNNKRNNNKNNYNERKISNRSKRNNEIEDITFGEEIGIIKNDIYEDISECNEKQEKNIIILIDFNIYNKQEEDIKEESHKIDIFIEQTIMILSDYLSTNDRLCVLTYAKQSELLCPLMKVNKIDKYNFSNDLMHYKSIFFNENYETEEYNINLTGFNLGVNINISEHLKEDSLDSSEKDEKIYNKIKGLVEAINYINIYIKMKEEVENEKYIIIFTDFLNIQEGDDEKIINILNNIEGDIKAILLLIGKSITINPAKDKKNIFRKNVNLEELILNNFGEKSQVINFDNIKKIKTILSNNNVIKDEIIYPNELYK